MPIKIRSSLAAATVAAVGLIAAAGSAPAGTPAIFTAAEFFAPSGSQANGLQDFETEITPGQTFLARASGQLASIEVVFSDQASRIPPELSRDLEMRVYRMNGNQLGEILGMRTVPHEEIPDGLDFSNYETDVIEFAAEGVNIMIEDGERYAFVVSLDEPFTNPSFGSPTILGLAEFAGAIYTEGESFRHNPDGTITFLFGPPPPGSEGVLDFFFRVNLQEPQLSADVNGDGACDAFDVIAYLMLFNAEDDLADVNGDGALTDLDLVDFLTLAEGPC